MCTICKHAASDGFEECPKCRKKFYRCPTCGQPWAEEPRNLAKPNAQPALDVVAIKAVDFNHLLVQLDTMSLLVREDNFRADNRATFERMIKALQKELSKYESNDV